MTVSDLLLGPLADNGGFAPTHALLFGSPAIDAIDRIDCAVATDQRGVPRPLGAACDIGAYEFGSVVEISIKPGGPIKPINPKSHGVIPVAILGSDTCDVDDVDVATLVFGAAGSAGALPAHRRGGHRTDVNGDGLTDLLSHYRSQDTGIGFGQTEACVAGELLDGTPFGGCDSIRTVPDPSRLGSGRRGRD